MSKTWREKIDWGMRFTELLVILTAFLLLIADLLKSPVVGR